MPAWNRSYVHITGAYTGSTEKLYIIEMLSDQGTSWKWKTKTGSTSSSYTTVSSYNLNESVSLDDGVSVKFTRTSKSSYNNGDVWEFKVFPDLKLTDGVNKAYDHLDIIEIGTRKDLLALNSSNGNVTVIKDYESDVPAITEHISALAPSEGGYDIVRKNKELYVAGGKESKPRWIGNTKNGGFTGELGDYAFVADNAYNEVTVNSTDKMTFDDHVYLKGGAAGFNAGAIIAGINKEDMNVYVQNIVTNKVYSFPLESNPHCIRLNSAQWDGTSSSDECNGFAVLCDAVNTSDINQVEFFSVPTTGTIGQSTNKDKVLRIPKPTDVAGNEYFTKFTDFLIFCETYDQWTANKNHHMVFATYGGDYRKFEDGAMFKYDDGARQTGLLTAGNFVNITPRYGGYDVDGNGTEKGFVHVEDYTDYQDNQVTDIFAGSSFNGKTEERRIELVQRLSLGFCGYDANGANPVVSFTCEIQPPEKNYTFGSASGHYISGLWTDGGSDTAGERYALRWVTSLVGYGNSGPTQQPILAHASDYATTETKQMEHWAALHTRFGLTGSDRVGYGDDWTGNPTRLVTEFAPATYPYHCANGTIDGGKKLFWYQDKANNDYRAGLIVTRLGNADSVRVFKVPYISGTAMNANDGLYVFPNTNQQAYDAINMGSYNYTKPDYIKVDLQMADSSSGDFTLGDRNPRVTLSGGYPAALESWTAMRPVGGGDPMYQGNETEFLWRLNLSATDTSRSATNLFNAAVPWLTCDTATAHASKDWVGPTIDKAFYKFSLIYDGYQESTLLNLVHPFSDSNGVSKAITFTLNISQGSNVPISSRVTGIAVYRGDDQEHDASDPENLYRFVMEIPLYKFSNDSANNKWTYNVVDSGDVEGTYGAINGIAETMHSLSFNYTLNCSLNGYMFAGNCNHSQFDDAENVIFRSQPGKYSLFDWSKDFVMLDFVPTAIEGFMGKLYVFGDSQMCIINPESLIIEESIDGIGCIGPKAIKTTSTGLYWFDNTNIYNSSPNIQKIGHNIKAQEQYGWDRVTLADKKKAVAGYDMNRQSFLIFFYSDTYSNNKVWAYYSTTKRWDLWETSHRVYDTVTSSDGYCILLLDEGRIKKYTAGGNKRDWQWNSKKISFGTDTNYKKVRVAKVDANSRASTTLTYITNDEDSFQSGTDVSNNYGTDWLGNAIKLRSQDSKLRWLKLKVQGDNNTSSSNIRAHSLGVVYKPKKPK